MSIDVKFWGVRGSVPAPLTPEQVRQKILEGIQLEKEGKEIPLTFGGNTTCVEVTCGGQSFILDMGTGVRELGNEQMKKAFAEKRLSGTILQSHVHWDHIQGFPFWKPMYLPRRQFDCYFEFYGGKAWDSQLDLIYRGQMNPPVFPVSLEELEQTAMRMKFETIWDGWEKWFNTKDADGSRIKVLARKLWHPQETFGYRIEFNGKSVAFTTDHEPYAAGIPRGLAELVQGADIWITDCQYSHEEYIGKIGAQKMGWGHSFPGYISEVALDVKPKLVITTHHDPEASDGHIIELASQVQSSAIIETRPAYEGMRVSV
jgi:phosphoribosyl 1,2-cyclic phosphodiesterase